MTKTLRPEVQELLRVCDSLEQDDAVLTGQEWEAILRCATALEKKVLPDRYRSD